MFLIILVITLNFGIFAQTSQCDFSVGLFDVETIQSINEVEIKLLDFENKKQKSISKDFEVPTFISLDSGTYQIELKKKGYKKKVKKFLIDCNFADNSNRVFENIFLWKGSDKEIIQLDSTDTNNSVSGGNSDQGSFKVSNDNKPRSAVAGKVVNLVKPVYPPAAAAVKASGQVNVQVTIDEDGNVIKAIALDGHPLLKGSAIKAVRQSKFSPTLLESKPVKVTGVIVFNFSK